MYNILLVQMPWSTGRTPIVPLGLLVLGTGLRELQEEGYQLEYGLADLDFFFKMGELTDDARFYDSAANLLDSAGADAYFFSTHGPNESIVVPVIEKLKQRRPDCLVVVGGVIATLQASRYLDHFPEIDVVIKGEGEPALKPLVQAAMSDHDFSKVPSAVYRQGGQTVENPRVFVGKDQGFWYPDYSLVDLKAYALHSKRQPYLFPGFTPVESGRGCPNKCSFCGPAQMWNRRVRHRAIPQILDEMAFVAEHGFKFIFLTQDNLDERFLKKFCQALLKANLPIHWGCYAQLYKLSDEIIELMVQAGCRHVFVGFEAPDPEVQKFINKTIDREKSIQKVHTIGSLGVRLIASFVACAPGETKEQFENTLDFALECSVGFPLGEIRRMVRGKSIRELPAGMVHQCVVNPLACSPGTDFHREYQDQLRFVEASTNEEAFGSYLFGPNPWVQKNWNVISNSCCTVLADEDFYFYYSALRVFNAFIVHPWALAWFLEKAGQTTLQFMVSLVHLLGGPQKTLALTPERFGCDLELILEKTWCPA